MLSLPSEVAGFSEPEFRGSEEIELARARSPLQLCEWS